MPTKSTDADINAIQARTPVATTEAAKSAGDRIALAINRLTGSLVHAEARQLDGLSGSQQQLITLEFSADIAPNILAAIQAAVAQKGN